MNSAILKLILVMMLANGLSGAAIAKDNRPYLYVLGVVQDAGYPQTGCYQSHCMPGWENTNLRRGAVSLGLIDPTTHSKFMFEATPNFPAQLYQLDKIAPNNQFTLKGIFVTHAHIGHYAGLMFLGHEAMGASNVPVFAMPKMANFLRTNGPWEQLVKYKNILISELKNNRPQVFKRLKITPFVVPHRDEYSETVGYRIQGPNKTAVFIPDINKWEQWNTDIATLIKEVDYALIDAAFYADGELPGRDMSKIPHPFVAETIDTLKHLSQAHKNKVWFIHMNHTNPLLDANSKENKLVQSLGYGIATEGLRLVL